MPSLAGATVASQFPLRRVGQLQSALPLRGSWMTFRSCFAVGWLRFVLLLLMAASITATTARHAGAQQRREREPNAVYATRRAQLAAQIDAPIILQGLTGREESSQDY